MQYDTYSTLDSFDSVAGHLVNLKIMFQRLYLESNLINTCVRLDDAVQAVNGIHMKNISH